MDTRYTLHTTDGTETSASLCRDNSVTIFEVMRINPTDVSIDLADSQLTGNPLPSGLVVRIPVSNTGSVESGGETYITKDPLEDAPEGTTSSLPHNMMQGLGSSIESSGFNCSVYVILDDEAGDAWTLPVFPQEFSDNNSANFNSQSLLGRSVDYQIYQGSSRSTSFVLNLHNELTSDYSYVHRLVAYIESACYPGYGAGIVQVPEICFIIGNQFKIRGILESCNATWKAPIIDGMLVNCDLSITVKETTGPYSNDQVRSFGGKRG